MVRNETFFPPKIKNKARMSLLPFLLNIIVEVLAFAIRKGNKRYTNREGKQNKTKLSLFTDEMVAYKISQRINNKENNKIKLPNAGEDVEK